MILGCMVGNSISLEWVVSHSKELAVAREIARLAGEAALRHMRAGVQPESKEDESPVTIADREAEALIVSRLSEAFPDDGIMGEEGANRATKSGRRWIVDPVDGTRDFVRGTERWAVLLGLEESEGGRILVGVAHFPVTGQTYYAVNGGGAFCNNERIHASPVTQLKDAIVHLNGLIQNEKMPYRDRLLDWVRGAFAVRSMGGAPDAMLVASGKSDIWLEPGCKPWDLAPVKLILEEAGARFFTLSGGNGIYENNALACAPGLEAEVRRFVGLS